MNQRLPNESGLDAASYLRAKIGARRRNTAERKRESEIDRDALARECVLSLSNCGQQLKCGRRDFLKNWSIYFSIISFAP